MESQAIRENGGESDRRSGPLAPRHPVNDAHSLSRVQIMLDNAQSPLKHGKSSVCASKHRIDSQDLVIIDPHSVDAVAHNGCGDELD